MAMEAVLGMPLTTFLTRLSIEPFTVLKTIFLFWWLKFLRRKRRFDLYDPLDPDLTKKGAVIPPLEFQVEKPQQEIWKNTSEAILIYGGNTPGDRLVARVSRHEEGHVAWLYLRLADGRSYELPHPEKNYPSAEDFVAGGLKIKCLSPMRRWRVSVNGLLREICEDKKSYKVSHVKFSFICVSSADIYDLSTDIHLSVLADFLAKQGVSSTVLNPSSITKYLDTYVQTMNCYGSVSVDGSDDLEVNLWGGRKRSREILNSKGSTHSKEFLGYTKDGQLIYSGEIVLPGLKNKLPFAYYLERTTLTWPVTYSALKVKGNQAHFSGMSLDIKTVRSSVTAAVSFPSTTLTWQGFGLNTKCHISKFQLQDGDIGHGIYLENDLNPLEAKEIMSSEWRLPKIDSVVTGSNLLSLPLCDQRCQNPSLTGGKGASLAALTHLSTHYKTSFSVPNGFVLTTQSYEEFYQKSGLKDMITNFEKNIWSFDAEKIKETCSNIEYLLSQSHLPETLLTAVKKHLKEQFPDNGTIRRFAVRSSASGEDSEDMSAAGQMSTILGVENFGNICKAVAKCWASQFSFTAIQYKRQNGQILNSPMAVVVQEMVPADTAGVLFTCDPVTGNPQSVTITANYGLGESVVSASAEPDTLVMHRDQDNGIQLKSAQIGRKKVKIIMGEQGNVLEEEVDESSSGACCLTEVLAHTLTESALKIEEAYGFPVDIEWAFRQDKLYILQARPVTTVDKETRLEISHSISGSLRAEDEFISKANVGEVMPGASSHFGTSNSVLLWGIIIQKLYAHRNKYGFPFSPFNPSIFNFMGHIMVNIPNVALRFYSKGSQSFLAEATVYSTFGRKLEDENMLNQADLRNKMYPSTFVPKQIMYFIADLLFGGKRLNEAREKYWNTKMDLSDCSTSKEMYVKFLSESALWQTLTAHMTVSMNGSLLNNIALGPIAKDNGGWDEKVFSDFALILSSCGKLESADIPNSILVVSKAIKNTIEIEKFKQMSTEEALKWLENSKTSAGTAFQDMLQKHGHRCIREIDLYSKPWRMNKLPLVKILQETCSQKAEDSKKVISTEEIIKKLQVNISWKTKLLLRVLIPLCQNAVFCREKSKSLAMKVTDACRLGAWSVAEQLEKEGRLPDKELMFFLSVHEVMELIETRNPTLVQRAIRRKQIYPELDKLQFPEISCGIPQPLNRRKVSDESDLQSDLEMHGTPVSRGTIKAFARVAVDIEEASNIQPGEILIAYSTDIAWSPYFPLLSGVATELGGLISHGAVVSREYGLPCVVGVHDATSRFKTGDYVYLDGNKGILKRIPPPDKD